MDDFQFPEEFEQPVIDWIDEIEFTNGATHRINTNLSLAQMKRFKAQGLIGSETLSLMMSGKIDGVLDDKTVQNAPFICYKAAGGEMTQEEFEELLPYEVDVYMQIYMQMITSKKAQKNNHFRSKLKVAGSTGKK